MKTTLADLRIGESGIVKDVIGSSTVTKRLMEMGVLPGVTIKIIKTAPLGCPIQIRVRGYDLAIRKSEAESIEIQRN